MTDLNLPPDAREGEREVRLVLTGHVFIDAADGETYGLPVAVNLYASTTIDFDQLRAHPGDFRDLIDEHAHGLLAKIVGDGPAVTAFICGTEQDGVHVPGVGEIIAGALPLIVGE